MNLPLGNGNTAEVILHTQWLEKSSSTEWGTEIVREYSDGMTPCEAHTEISGMWQEYYQDMIDFGIPTSVLNYYASSISNVNNTFDRKNSGIYAEDYLSACGYAGAAGTIACGLDASEGTKQYYLSHENTHGFQWDFTEGKTSENILRDLCKTPCVDPLKRM